MLSKFTLDIGEVAKKSGLPASTLRFYEEKGLIEAAGRNGLRRFYSAEVLEALSLITLGRKAGFTLDEIAGMFTASGPKIDKARLMEKAELLDNTISQLMAMRDGLVHAANCPATTHFECPTFQRLLRAANKDQIRKRNQKKRK